MKITRPRHSTKVDTEIGHSDGEAWVIDRAVKFNITYDTTTSTDPTHMTSYMLPKSSPARSFSRNVEIHGLGEYEPHEIEWLPLGDEWRWVTTTDTTLPSHPLIVRTRPDS